DGPAVLPLRGAGVAGEDRQLEIRVGGVGDGKAHRYRGLGHVRSDAVGQRGPQRRQLWGSGLGRRGWAGRGEQQGGPGGEGRTRSDHYCGAHGQLAYRYDFPLASKFCWDIPKRYHSMCRAATKKRDRLHPSLPEAIPLAYGSGAWTRYRCRSVRRYSPPSAAAGEASVRSPKSLRATGWKRLPALTTVQAPSSLTK